MKAVVLAGGLGTRLYPLTKVAPKPMIPLAGKPILEYIVDGLVRHGFTDIIIAARYLGTQVVEYFKGHPYAKPVILDSKDTADAVRLLDGVFDDHFIVSMGDTLCNADYREIYDYHKSSNAVATIALKQVENPLPYGIVYLDEHGDILLFIEKPLSIEVYLLSLAYYRQKGASAYENLINAGIYVFNPHILEILERNPGLMDFGRHVFPYLVENGYRVRGHVLGHSVYWNDIGRLETYKSVAWDMLDGRIPGLEPAAPMASKGVYIHDSAIVRGRVNPPVYIGRSVVVEEGASVGPYAVLEDNAVVGKGSVIQEGIVWRDTLIGEGSRIYDSILMNRVEVAPGSTLVSTVVGTGSRVSGELSKMILDPVEVTPPYA
ncbi:sugar phosphate nucleotidyltransferase [Desulfurococcus mucosus]|uniref:Nucleotidyl transferase n=1 Tax=Desulfurococcus mucosus (strain ATCC 35584 / DSM 2162 / JCM 9187 / O7/1) TaxID=765177 RepID=E8R806_DESM0|nr:NDP-sugar synthase [Desulfurococcus mucosus]ADV64632.1 Nucleotidyl transferase [Desulfurococcus mucosus DSM 2162]